MEKARTFLMVVLVLSFGILFTPQSLGQVHDEWLRIIVNGDGSIGVQLIVGLREPMFANLDVLDLSLLRCIKSVSLNIEYNSKCRLSVTLDGKSVGLQEADIIGYDIARKISYRFLGGDCTLSEKDSFTHPLTGALYISLYYTPVNVDFDKIVNSVWSEVKSKCRCSDGFINVIHEKHLCKEKSSIFVVDDLEKSPSSTFPDYYANIYVKFQGYFDFKVGYTYVLDIYKLFNLTNPLMASKSSSCSAIDISLLSLTSTGESRTDIFYELLDVYFSSINYRVGVGIESITISNYFLIRDQPPPFYIPGKVIDGLWVKFKVVEQGYKFDVGTSSFGVILIISSLIIFCLIMFLYVKERCSLKSHIFK